MQADARSIPLRDGCVQTVVTSPPYFGLRDYGTATWDGGENGCLHRVGNQVQDTKAKGAITAGVRPGIDASHCLICGAVRIDKQIGIESTPDAYVAQIVAVFREVRRVLKDDGTVWLNLGDSYSSNPCADGSDFKDGRSNRGRRLSGGLVSSLKPKDLLGIPWRVAFALQQPYYSGAIKRIEDRIWLAAMLDAEGCMFIHKRKAGQNNGHGYQRQNDNYGPGVEISNTSLALVERIAALVGKGSICSQGPNENHRRKQTIYRWNLRTTESRVFVQELYPYLVAKQQQARILCGCPSSGPRAEAAHSALIDLHRTGSSGVDFDPPVSLFTPGWYLRSDVIWAKNNPMPESVQDRPTKAHEYVFLLAKSERYYYDADAIREPQSPATIDRFGDGQAPRRAGNKQGGSSRSIQSFYDSTPAAILPNGRNRRSVWMVPTMPYAGAHFATMPEALVKPCILAGSRPGDVVFDPFIGSGTVGAVAERFGRRWVGTDLNVAYHQLAKKRTAQRGLSFGGSI